MLYTNTSSTRSIQFDFTSGLNQKTTTQYYQIVAEHGKNTCQLCKEKDGKMFLKKDLVVGKNFPPFHPNCNCYAIDEEGKVFSNPNDLTIREAETIALMEEIASKDVITVTSKEELKFAIQEITEEENKNKTRNWSDWLDISKWKDVASDLVGAILMFPEKIMEHLDSEDASYLQKTLDQLLRGKYTENETALGTILQIGAGIIGIDAAADIRDLSYNIKNWEWSFGHVVESGLIVASLVPLIGGARQLEEIQSLNILANRTGSSEAVLQAVRRVEDDGTESVLAYFESLRSTWNNIDAMGTKSIQYTGRTDIWIPEKWIPNEIGSLEKVEQSILLKEVKGRNFPLWTEASTSKEAIQVLDRKMDLTIQRLPDDFIMPEKIVLCDFETAINETNMLGGYTREVDTAYFNSKYINDETILKEVQKTEGWFANQTSLAPYLHELGHKYHYTLIERLADKKGISYEKASELMNQEVQDFITDNKINVKILLSGYAKYGLDKNETINEIMAEYFTLSSTEKRNRFTRFLDQYVKEINK